MSLIHQVLQDLDGRPEQRTEEIIGYAEEHRPQRLVIWPAIVISLVSAAAVIYFSNYFNKVESNVSIASFPILPVVELTADNNIPARDKAANQLPELLQVAPAELVNEVLEGGEREAEASMQEGLSPEVLFQSESISVNAASEEFSQPFVAAESVSAAPSSSSMKESSRAIEREASVPSATLMDGISDSQSTPMASITRRTSAEDYYVKAIAHYRNGDWQSSLAELAHASNISADIDYQAMKARIFLEQGMRDQFVAVYESHASNRNVDWLSVIAPGLHMFGFYSEAVEQYQHLSEVQPRNVAWSIAKTQALIDAGMTSQAEIVLRHIEENYALNEQQLSWLRYQRRILE